MTCYARPVLILAVLLTACLAAAGLSGLLAIMAAVVSAAGLASAVIALTISRVTRSRSAAGACTACRHPCQSAMTAPGRPVDLPSPIRWPEDLACLEITRRDPGLET